MPRDRARSRGWHGRLAARLAKRESELHEARVHCHRSPAGVCRCTGAGVSVAQHTDAAQRSGGAQWKIRNAGRRPTRVGRLGRAGDRVPAGHVLVAIHSQNDCGLPAGPFGLFGAAEGISYLIVAGVVVAALVKKATTGSGFQDEEGALPLKGLAEGLCFLTAFVGLAVLGAQLLEYGFVPEAVPVEGGRCSNIG